jgi:hypothetical protein
MRAAIIIILTLVLFKLSSQTKTGIEPFSSEATTAVGISTMQTCLEMKSNCKSGKLIANENHAIADTTLVYLDGFIKDITGKKIPYAFIKLINQQNKDSHLSIADSLGRLKLVINAGTYSLKINAFGYQEFFISDLKFGAGDMRKIIVDVGEYCCTKTKVTFENHGYPNESQGKKTNKR